MSLLYLYAIAPRAPGLERTAVRGLEDAPLRWHPVGDLVAAVASLAREPALELDNLRTHDRAVRELARDVPAILPVRFRQILADEDELAQCLAHRAARLGADLERVRGCEQMTWRVFGERQEEPEPERADAGPGTRYLARLAARRVPAALEPLLDALAPWIRAQRVESGRRADLLASVYHLVRTGDLDAYRAELGRPRAALAPLRLGVSGPWLPYAFSGGPEDV